LTLLRFPFYIRPSFWQLICYFCQNRMRSLRNLSYLVLVLAFLTSCTAARKSSSSTASKPSTSQSPKFIEGISINPGSSQTTVSSPSDHIEAPAGGVSLSSGDIENFSDIRFKFAILMDLPVESLSNQKLFGFLEEWYGVPYRYGGSTKSGIDCSAFTCSLMTSVYGITLPRNSKEQYSTTKRIKKDQLTEGDLVFFKTKGRITHVGVYLGNNKFAHASTSSGVMISDLDEAYFSKRYAGSGRIK
jgi:hypothetical protein